MAELTHIRESVRERYAQAATAASGCGGGSSTCCAPAVSTTDETGNEVFGAALYKAGETEGATDAAVNASLGCGVPTAVADLHEGETVLDLGSGAGADVLISARRVGPAGRAIGLDMTDEMLTLARANAIEAGVDNVEFVKGYIEEIPLPEASVDVVISNCVINLSGDKARVIAEAARVLRPGGRFAVSDVIADENMDEATRADMRQWTGCIAGALTRAEFEDALTAAGLVDVEIRETHRVHEHAASAIVRARKPSHCAGAGATTTLPPMRRALLSLLCLAALLALAGCGSSSSDDKGSAPAKPSPAVAGAEKPEGADFPDTAGKTLQEVADGVNSGPQVGLATATFVPGANRVAFGMIGADNAFLYGPTALYFAKTPSDRAEGPFLAPLDSMQVQPAFASQNASADKAGIKGIYSTELKLPKPGKYAVLAVTNQGGNLQGATSEITVSKSSPIPNVGDAPPTSRRRPRPRSRATSRASTRACRPTTCTR